MADLTEIKHVADEAARQILRSTDIVEVSVEPEISADGDDLLRVRIIIPDGQIEALDFDQFFHATLSIKDSIKLVGDGRQTLVGFITPSELAQRDNPEP